MPDREQIVEFFDLDPDRSVNCIVCGRLFDERDSLGSLPDNEGSICPDHPLHPALEQEDDLVAEIYRPTESFSWECPNPDCLVTNDEDNPDMETVTCPRCKQTFKATFIG
jgi:hypothetical protein